MAALEEFIYLSNEQYQTLYSTGSVTIDGVTLTYDPDHYIYVTPEENEGPTSELPTYDSTNEDNILSVDSSGDLVWKDLLDTDVKLEEDLYVYTNVGLITGASATSPIQVGNAGDTIKTVFNKMFVGDDENPTVTKPTLSLSKATHYGQTNAVVLGEKIYPKFTASYGTVNGYYQYGSTENPSSTSTGVTAGSSTFTIGSEASITGTISNSSTTQTLSSTTLTTVKNSGSSVSVSGTVNLVLTNVKTARTRLGAKASAAKSGSTGSISSTTGKLTDTTVTKTESISITPEGTLSTTAPSAAITLSGQASGSTFEVGTSVTVKAKITASNATGIYPYGYFTNNTGTKNSSTDAGCVLTTLSLKKDSTTITSDVSKNDTYIDIPVSIAENSNNISISGSLTFSCDTTRYPATANGNTIDTTVKDYRIGEGNSTYTATPTSKSWTATGVYYDYYKLASTTTAPTSGATKITNRNSTEITVDSTAGQYLYFYTRSSKTTIQQYIAGGWNNVATTAVGNVTLTLSTGATKSYYVYRMSDSLATTTGLLFRIQ